MHRRAFLALPLGLIPVLTFGQDGDLKRVFDLRQIERARVLRFANQCLKEAPITVTAAASPRSAGGPHDYFSEGDYWWPDPANPDGPYIQRDGMTNPDNFVAHRHALIRLSVQMPALTAAWVLTTDRKYSEHAARHLRAWFIDPATKMNPHLLYAQAIKGRMTGRGTGIIDTVHLVEVVRAITALEGGKALAPGEASAIKDWFSRYLTWMTSHQYGIDERDTKNNHATCWVMQAAEFARYTNAADVTAFCRDRFKNVFVPDQMAMDGSFPLELARTKPYGYSLFNLDAMAMVAQILTTPADNLWTFRLPDGRSMARAMEFMVPYIQNKSRWPYKPDVMYFEEWPVRQPSLIMAGFALQRSDYLELAKRLNPDPTVEEVVRNFIVRQPLLWIDQR